MQSYGSITYTDVINQVTQHGWNIESQTPNSTVITKAVGAPALVVIPLAIIPVLGMLVGIAWIAARGKTTVTIERRLTQARVLTPRNEFDINGREDMELFLNDHNYKGNVGYYPVAAVGGVVLFLLFVGIQFLAAGGGA